MAALNPAGPAALPSVRASAGAVRSCMLADELLSAQLDAAGASHSNDGRWESNDGLPAAALFAPPVATPLPQVVADAVRHARVASLRGLFPELSCAWFTADNELYLWDYSLAPSAPHAVSVYSSLDACIVSCGVVPVTPAFGAPVQALIAVATLTEVVLVEVRRLPAGAGAHFALHSTNLAVPTDGIRVLKIEGAIDGRVFLAGKRV